MTVGVIVREKELRHLTVVGVNMAVRDGEGQGKRPPNTFYSYALVTPFLLFILF